jgi:NADH-quinone oxidoreductase subunit L
MFRDIWIIPVLPVLAAALTAGVFVPRRSISPVASLPVVLVSAANVVLAVLAYLAFREAGPQHLGLTWVQIGSLHIGVGTLMDPLSVTMLLVVSAVSFLVLVFSIGYMAGDPGFSRYFCYMGLFVAAMLGLVIADSLILIYICWELVGICSYLLIGFWYGRNPPANAAKKAFIVTRFGDMGLLLGLILLATSAQTFDLAAVRELVHSGGLKPVFIGGSAFLTTVSLLVFFGAMGKSAQFPLHVWLPDAMEGPTPVSALIHAATMVAAGVFLVARLFFLYEAAPLALNVVAWVGTVTALMAATIAVVQFDIKRLLAYSTISQLGYMMLGLGVGGTVVGIFHLGTHAFFKALLFLTAGSVIVALHHKQDMREMGGLWRRMPVTCWTCLAGALALAGIFPFAGFWSKDEILASAIHAGQLHFYVVGVAVAGLTAFYMGRLWFMTFFGPPRTDEAVAARESPLLMTVPLLLFALFALIAGAANLPGTHSLSSFLSPGEHPSPANIPVMATGLAVAMLGIIAAVLVYRRSPEVDPITKLPAALYKFLERKWFVDDFYEMIIARAAVGWAALTAWFDRAVVNGLVDLTAWTCGVFGGIFRLATSGQPQFYAAIVILAAALAMWWFKVAGPDILWVRTP